MYEPYPRGIQTHELTGHYCACQRNENSTNFDVVEKISCFPVNFMSKYYIFDKNCDFSFFFSFAFDRPLEDQISDSSLQKPDISTLSWHNADSYSHWSLVWLSRKRKFSKRLCYFEKISIFALILCQNMIFPAKTRIFHFFPTTFHRPVEEHISDSSLQKPDLCTLT